MSVKGPTELLQGQELAAVMTPDYLAEGATPFAVGENNCTKIVVSQLAGPMGHYDVAVVYFDSGGRQIIPLHHCDFIQPKARPDEGDF